MSKKILSIVLVVLMLVSVSLSLSSCKKERTEEEIINDIVNNGTTALTLSIWIPTESDSDSQEFNERLKEVEEAFNVILRDKNYSTEVELTAVSSDEYEKKLSAHLEDIEKKVAAKKGLLPSNVSQKYVNKAIKVPYGDSYMYELAYPDVLDTQLDLFMIRNYDDYKALVQKENLYSLDSYISKLGGQYSDIHRMISPAVFSQYVIDKSTYAIPNNHKYTNESYQYILIDKAAVDTVEGFNVENITDIFACEEFINAIGSNTESGFVPFVATLNDAPGIINFDNSGLIGSTLVNPEPSNIFDIESYNNYVQLYKKLQGSSFVKESLSENEKAAVSFFYGTNEDVKALEENYYVVKSEKTVAYSEDIFSSMFAISKYSANYDRAMKILYLLQTNSELITLLQYGIEDKDYTIEVNDEGEEYIKVSDETVYNMSGLNIGNSYHTYLNDGSTLDSWAGIKESNYDLTVSPYLNFSKNFEENATDEEKAKLAELTEKVNELGISLSTVIASMSYDEYIKFIEVFNYDIEAINTSLEEKQKELDELKAAETLDEENIASIEAEIADIKAQQDAYNNNVTVNTVKGSSELSELIALYKELYGKYNVQ